MAPRGIGWRLAGWALAGVVVATTAAATSPRPALPPEITDPALAQADYIEQCGGCHGVDGRSAPAQVPELRARVGFFLCTADTRTYLVRLPNVAHSRIGDNQRLADLINYVVFGLGGASTPRDARPLTADEVAHGRRTALTQPTLKAERARQVEVAIRRCHAPVALRQYYTTAHS